MSVRSGAAEPFRGIFSLRPTATIGSSLPAASCCHNDWK